MATSQVLTNNEYLENLKMRVSIILTKIYCLTGRGCFSSATKSPDRAEISTNKKISVDSTGKFCGYPFLF